MKPPPRETEEVSKEKKRLEQFLRETLVAAHQIAAAQYGGPR